MAHKKIENSKKTAENYGAICNFVILSFQNHKVSNCVQNYKIAILCFPERSNALVPHAASILKPIKILD